MEASKARPLPSPGGDDSDESLSGNSCSVGRGVLAGVILAVPVVDES